MDFKILLVDDFDIIRMSLKKILNQHGIRDIQEASDGIAAFEKLNLEENRKKPFDLIFLDWNMPRMNGLEFLIECKKSDDFKTIPIIMTTAERERKSVIAALNAGATDYIVKPFKAFVIQDKLEKFLTKKSA